jgi:chemotaxis protein MotB
MPFRNTIGTVGVARKKKHEEHENLERWLVSYADFITLLFAFFVVMYSISSVNEGKYRVLSDSITKAFSGQVSAKPIKLGDPVKAPIQNVINQDAANRAERPATNAAGGDERQLRELNQVTEEVNADLKPLIEQSVVSVTKNKDSIEIEINTSILFASGSSGLQSAALPVLRTLARILGDKPFNLQVEGFTDNVPIASEVFPSNWELSAARAAGVVRVFADEGIPPQRLAAVGFGEYRPAADNNSEDGRRKNRRVKIVVLPPAKDGAQARMFNTGTPVATPPAGTLPDVEAIE